MPTTLRDRAALELEPHRRAVGFLAVPAAAWAVWASGPGWTTPALVVLAVAGAALGVIDARTHRLPDAISLPASGVFAALLLGAAAGSGDWPALARAAGGAALLGAAYWLLHRLHRSGLGFGDVKLAPVLGAAAAWHGWTAWSVAAVAPFLLGGLVALALLLARRARRDSVIPFGPYMLAGTAAALTLARLGT
ncbi:prepilin peptidase [Antribacter gilvus]|uniref:prepilin peptidase n=1 Tax=Antribacter gilvus TaxID=2304675 RepID=UPI000F771AAC|nr:A24 family peptidase [Antribacter gilvus]